jgi:hypothetical protein
MSLGKVAPQTFPIPTVPEVPITKDDNTGAREYQIGLAGELGDTFPVT